MSFFRYPGGKNKLKGQIVEKLKECITTNNGILEYREPFLGGGNICINMIDTNLKRFYLNDYDIGLACLWTTVLNYPEELIERVLNFKPSVDDFYNYKNYLISIGYKEIDSFSKDAIISIGFKKMVLHQISYSGLGIKSGGPLGGKKQLSNYKIDCRWSPLYISKKINKISSLLNSKDIVFNKCTNHDFGKLLENLDETFVVYLDPPYFVKGSELYHHSFEEQDHIRLSEYLKKTKAYWVLSYDNCDYIVDLYKDWSNINVITGINYTINTSRKDKFELLISNF